MNISIFISHSWTYSEHYNTLAKWIFEKEWGVDGIPLNFIDNSVPRNDPIHYAMTDDDLMYKINSKIMISHVVVIPTGMYVNHSKWIKKEIEGSKLFRKPILAVNPWGQQKKSVVVQSSAQETVGWNKQY